MVESGGEFDVRETDTTSLFFYVSKFEEQKDLTFLKALLAEWFLVNKQRRKGTLFRHHLCCVGNHE